METVKKIYYIILKPIVWGTVILYHILFWFIFIWLVIELTLAMP